MAESLSTEQIEERRTNLRAFRTQLEMEDDSELNTTLLMQEEWLATVDELQGYARDAHIIRGLRTRKCLLGDFLGGDTCTDFWKKSNKMYCAPCYLRAVHKPVTEITELELYSISLDSDPLPSEEFDPEGEDWPEDMTTGWEDACICKGGFVDYLGQPCPVHPIPDEGEPVSEHRIRPMPPCDDRPECEASGQAHVWVKLGKVNEAAIMEWGPSKCLRCNEPYDLEFAGSDE